MKGYGQFCPVAKGAEVFAERWTPLVLRELLCGASAGFAPDMCAMSSTLSC